jgi:hypothetical protein
VPAARAPVPARAALVSSRRHGLRGEAARSCILPETQGCAFHLPKPPPVVLTADGSHSIAKEPNIAAISPSNSRSYDRTRDR